MPGTNYIVRTETPADYSGLEGLVPRIGAVGEASDNVKAQIAALSERLANMGGGSFGQQAQAQIQSAKESAGGGGIEKAGKEAESALPELVSFAAEALSIGEILHEVGENDAAAAKLAQFGVSAEQAGQAAEQLEGLKLFFSGDGVKAAEAYGKIINGNTRGLEQLGIQLDATSTMEQRKAAIEQLAARGLATQAAQNETLTGSLKLLGRGIVDVTANGVGWLANTLGITGALSWLNEKLGFAATKTKEMEDAQKSAETSTTDLNTALKKTPDTAADAAKAIQKIASAAEAASTQLKVMQKALDQAGKSGSDEELAALHDRLDVLNGKSEAEVKRDRANSNAAADADKRQSDASNAEIAITKGQETLAKLDELEKKQNADPSRNRFSDLAKKGAPATPEEQKAIEQKKKQLDDEEKALRDKQDRMLHNGGNAPTPEDMDRLRQIPGERGALGANRRTPEEEQEMNDLAERRRAEDEAINAKRREANGTIDSAKGVQADLPARKAKSALQQEVAQKEYEQAEKERKEKEENDRQRFEMEQGGVREKNYSDYQNRTRAEAEQQAAQRDAEAKEIADMRKQEAADKAGDVDKNGRRIIHGAGNTAPPTSALDEYKNHKGGVSAPETPGLDALKAAQKPKAAAPSADAAAKAVDTAGDKAVSAVQGVATKFDNLATVMKDIQTRLTTVEAQQGQ